MGAAFTGFLHENLREPATFGDRPLMRWAADVNPRPKSAMAAFAASGRGVV